jgi:hypothetical protein
LVVTRSRKKKRKKIIRERGLFSVRKDVVFCGNETVRALDAGLPLFANWRLIVVIDLTLLSKLKS